MTASASPERTVDGPTIKDRSNDDSTAVRDRLVHLQSHRTKRWYGLSGVALVLGGVAVLGAIPGLLLAGAVCVGVLGVTAIESPPEPAVAINRQYDPEPIADEDLTVTVTVENTGSHTLVDLRVVDQVPDAFAVVDGSPRVATALRPGAEVTFCYTVSTRQGHHEFGTPVVAVRGVTGTIEDEYRFRTDDTVDVVPRFRPLESAPLRALVTPFTGTHPTDTGGAGTEFRATREYRRGDPLNRIDWNRLARGGELATLEFRSQRAASVALVIDTREQSFLRPDEDTEDAVTMCLQAATRLFPTLLAAGHSVGIAALSQGVSWIPPDSGSQHRERVRESLQTDPAFAPTPTAGSNPSLPSVQSLRHRLSEETQVIVCSPLCDDVIKDIVQLLDAYGNRVTVLSPDPTTTDTRGHRVARVERQLRITQLRRTGVQVINWPPEENLVPTLHRSVK